MKYKVGDKVRVREDLEANKAYGKYELEEEQEVFYGVLAIIKGVNKTHDYYDLDIDNGEFFWTDEMLEPVAENIAESDENTDEVVEKSVESIEQFTKEDLKIGDIVTLRNGNEHIYIPIEEKLYNLDNMGYLRIKGFNNNLSHKTYKKFDIMKVERHIYEKSVYYKKENIYKDIYALQTLYERKKEILTEKEKEYLSKFIEPFRDRIGAIRKASSVNSGNEEWLFFMLDTENKIESFALPSFNKNTMYQGMKLKKDYTLEELGL